MLTKRIKSLLLRHLRGTVGSHMRGYSERGLVTWDWLGPTNENNAQRLISFVMGLEVASQFLQTDYTRNVEWVITGSAGRMLFASMPEFRSAETELGLYSSWGDSGLVCLGKLRHRKVYLEPDRAMAHSLLMFNDAGRVVRIAIVNCPY